jgi:hypothetical protein
MDDLAKLLIEKGLPTLATIVMGPLGGAAVEFVAGKLGLSDKTAEALHETISGMKPENLIALKTIEADLAKAQLESETKLATGQIETNKIEAAKPGYFNGWRPALGWICVIILGFAYIPKALALTVFWSVQCYLQFAHPGSKLEPLPPFPDLGISDVLGILGTLLGSAFLAKLRTDEKIAGAEGKR